MAIPLDPPRHTPLGRAERAGEGAEGGGGGKGAECSWVVRWYKPTQPF